MCVCVCVSYPVGEEHGGGSYLPALHLHLHLTPVFAQMIDWSDLTHHTRCDQKKKSYILFSS